MKIPFIILILLLWFGAVLAVGPMSLTAGANLEEEPAEAQLRPIQGIIPTRVMLLEFLPWAGGLLGLLLIVFGLARWYKRRRSKRRSIIPEDPPHIRARKEIEQLEARGVFEQGDIKGFYFLFSGILRRYLGSLRGFPAAGFTTEEIEHHVNSDQDRRLLALLQHADLVKFAGRIPTRARKEEEVRKALSYIQETSPPMETGHSMDETQGVSK